MKFEKNKIILIVSIENRAVKQVELEFLDIPANVGNQTKCLFIKLMMQAYYKKRNRK